MNEMEMVVIIFSAIIFSELSAAGFLLYKALDFKNNSAEAVAKLIAYDSATRKLTFHYRDQYSQSHEVPAPILPFAKSLVEAAAKANIVGISPNNLTKAVGDKLKNLSVDILYDIRNPEKIKPNNQLLLFILPIALGLSSVTTLIALLIIKQLGIVPS
ncbi:MAG: hypothetical protein ACOYK8_01340 [Alphaproteobacteria bacterium]